MPIQLTNSLGDIISAGPDTANAFNQEFTINYLPTDVFIPLTSDPFEHKQNVTIHDTYMTLLVSPNSASNPDDITGRLLRHLYSACVGIAVVYNIPTVAHARMFPQLLEGSSHSTNLHGK